MTKRVYSTSEQLSHLWAHDGIEHVPNEPYATIGRTPNTSYSYMGFGGDYGVLEFSSYATTIGVRVAPGTGGVPLFVLTSEKCSATTSKHQRELQRAVYGASVFTIPKLDTALFRPAMAMQAWRTLRSAVIRDVEALMRKAATANSNRALYITQASQLISQYNGLCAAMPQYGLTGGETLDVGQMLDIDLDLLKALIKQETVIAMQRKRERTAQTKQATALYVSWWRGGGIGECPPPASGSSTLPHTALRISSDGEHVETMRGAQIPVRHARRLWPVICLAKQWGDKGTDKPALLANAVGMKLGVYTLNSITAQGDTLVGCHSIEYEEMALIAEQLGLSTEGDQA